MAKYEKQENAAFLFHDAVHSLSTFFTELRLHCLLDNVTHKNLIPSTFPLTERKSIFKVLPIQKCRDIRKVL